MTVGPILQRETVGAPSLAIMADAELFLDLDAQTLWTRGLSEPISMKLGGQGVPKPSRYVEDADKVVVQTAAGLSYAVLLAGAGGHPQVLDQWLVPGVTATAVSSLAITPAGYSFEVEINAPVVIAGLRLISATQTAVSVSLTRAGFEQTTTLTTQTNSADPIADVVFLPDRYLVTVTPATTATFTALTGTLPGRTESRFPLFFMLDEQPVAVI